MMQILGDLAPLNRAVCSSGYNVAVDYLKELLPFRTIAIESSDRHNGWVIPPFWDIESATIKKDGRLIYDGNAHPLGMIALSTSYRGTVDLGELRRHMFYDHRSDTAIPFHYRQQFRSWDRDWGFCMPKNIYDALEPGKYEVDIRTKEAAGVLNILEYKHQGQLDYTIVLGSNLDHAGVANDGIAGCAVGLETFRRLLGRKTKFSYMLVLSPGIIGSEYYLARMPSEERARILEGVFLEMLGSETQLAVQEPRQSMASVHHALNKSLDHLHLSYRTGSFESIIVNDEYIWENYGIPMVSFSRFPYPGYHSSDDNLTIIKESSLNESVEALIGMIDVLEASPMVVRRFEGNICLSNPQYDLYVDYGQIALGDPPSEERLRLRRLMDLVPALAHPVSACAVANRVGLSEEQTIEYLQRWVSKGLVSLL